jgi:mono/diheme cytochrome c family protein
LFRPSPRKRVASLQAAAFVVAAIASTGCWEQMSNEWWPQMKWQRAVQAYELQGRPGEDDREIGNFMPPEGTVPVGMPMKASELTLAEGEKLPNPNPPTLDSLDNGRTQYDIYCAVCHGKTGLGDGPVAGPPYGKGPLVAVLPVAGPVGKALTSGFSDGHIFSVISQGVRRMPNYKRIPPSDRWDIVNYVRYLNGQVPGPTQAPQTASAPAPAAGDAAPAPDGTAPVSGGAN